MIKGQTKIIEKIDNLDFIKEYKKLKSKLKKDNKYILLINKLEKSTSVSDIINIKKELFEIPNFKKIIRLETRIRLLTKEINKTILDTVDNKSC